MCSGNGCLQRSDGVGSSTSKHMLVQMHSGKEEKISQSEEIMIHSIFHESHVGALLELRSLTSLNSVSQLLVLWINVVI